MNKRTVILIVTVFVFLVVMNQISMKRAPIKLEMGPITIV